MSHRPLPRLALSLAGVLGLALLLRACSQDGPREVPDAASTAPAEDLPYNFVDATRESGLAGFRQENGGPEKLFVVESFGAGVALFDADGDGDLDAYLTNGSHLEGLEPGEEPRDALYLNDGTGRFVDGTEAAGLGDTGWTTGVRIVDIDGDGDQDIYLTSYGPNVLYLNRGDGTFEDVTDAAGVGDPRWSTGACFLDFDRDGDLDLYVANYLVFDEEEMLRERRTGTIMAHRTSGTERNANDPFADVRVMFGPRGLPPDRDRFYVNQGDGTFVDASVELGIDGPELYGFQCIAFDADRDGWVDVYVANDVLANLLWHNDEGKGFTDQAMRAGSALSMSGKAQGGMGVAIGDYDADLWPDVYVTNYVDDYSTLYRGRPGGFFVDLTQRARLSDPTWNKVAWGCGFEDFDSDGDLEIFAGNGHVYPQVDGLDLGTTYAQENQLFELVDGRFVPPAGGGGPGFALRQVTRGAAVGDVDGDGDLDLLFGNLDDSPTLLRNEGPNGNRVRVRIVGAGGNRDAIGARVVARVSTPDGERAHLRLVGTGGSFLSSSEPTLHFGLGTSERIDELEVTWPDGRVDRFEGLAAGTTYVVEEGDDGATLRAE